MVIGRITAILLLFSGVADAQPHPSVAWLSPLVGVWSTRDTYHPVTGKPIVEEATRTCRTVMHESYLECESVVKRPDGSGRTYRFLINYNRITSRFEMLSIWSNHPPKAVHSLAPNGARDRWVLEDVAIVGDPEQSNHWSELAIEAPDRIVWTGRRVTDGSGDPRSAPISFQETWTRLGPAVRSPFWNGLESGAHLVGLRPEVVPRPGGSPVQVLVFSPADHVTERWTLRSLARATCVPDAQPAPPVDREACAARLVKSVAEYRPGAAADPALLDGALESGIDAPRKDGAWPLIVIDAGMRADALAHVALAEFLASHGFVVVALPSIPYAPGRALEFDAQGVTSKAESLAAAITAASTWRGVDASRVLVAAWSVGGVSTAAVAGRDARIKGVLSLDGALGYDYGPKLLAEMKAGAIDKPILHLTGALPNAYDVPKSTEVFTRLGRPTWVATVAGVNHAHFVLQGGVLPFANEVSADAAQFWRANRAIARLSVAFATWVLLDGRDQEAASRQLSAAGGPAANVVRTR